MFPFVTLEEWNKGIEEVKKEYNSIVFHLVSSGLNEKKAEIEASLFQLDKYKKIIEEF